MAQLPPKAPNMTPNWPEFTHQRLPSMDSCLPTNNNNNNNPSWVDEFLDFSLPKRSAHKRSISDSAAAFLESPLMDECRRSSAPGSGNTSDFERFDDEQLMYMFTDDMPTSVNNPTMSISNPSSPSDHNSINEDHHHHHKQGFSDQQLMMMQQQLKNEPDEVESSCKIEGQVSSQAAANGYEYSNEKVVDPKRIKRILANRQSAQRSRVRKLNYISELERSVTSLQSEVSILSPRVAFLDHQRMVLTVDNGVLKQRMAALAQDKIFKDAHQEALKREIERLRQIYYQQNMKQMENATTNTPQSKLSAVDTNGHADKEQLVN